MSGYADHVPESSRIEDPPGPADIGGGVSQGQSSRSRLPKSNSVNAATGENSMSEVFGVDAETVERARERTEEFREKYPERAKVPLSREPGETMLASYVVEEYREETVEPESEFDQGFTVRRLEKAEPVTWDEAVFTTLIERHRYDMGVVGEFEDRRTDEKFRTQFTDAWTTEYAEAQRAKNAGAQRQLMGGEYPENPESTRSGEYEPGEWGRPVSALLSLTGTAVPSGEQLAPVDHARRVDTWSEACYHRVRNLLEHELGVPSDRWGYTRADDVHGLDGEGGENACYTHQHPAIFFDLEAAEVPSMSDGEVEKWIRERFHEKVVMKHVEECDLASEDAHGPGSVEIEMDLNRAGAYASAYALPSPEKPMIERSIEYIAWASVLRASGSQRIARSQLFTEAAKADMCKQKRETVHGERLMYDRSGHGESELVCECCGSGVGIGETMTAHRMSGESQVVATDGGETAREKSETVVVGARIGESPEEASVRERAEVYVENREECGEVSERVLGEMGVSPEYEEVVREVFEGEDSSGVEEIEGEQREGGESRYELKELVAANGDRTEIAGGAGGVEYVELELPVEKVLRHTRLQYVGEDCRPKIWVELSEGEGGRFATYNPETAARALVNAGMRIPWVADRALSFESTDRAEFEEPVPRPGGRGE